MKWNSCTSCLQNPWLRGYSPQIPVISVLCPQLNLLNPPPEKNSWVRHCSAGSSSCVKKRGYTYLLRLKTQTDSIFTFILPCIVIDFFLNNQTDTLIIQIYSLTKPYMFRASSLPIIRSSLLYIQHWNTAVPSWLCLEAFIRNLHETHQCRMYRTELLMMGRKDARNM